MGWWNSNQWSWNLEWRRTLFEWEVGEERQLKQLLENKSLIKKRTIGFGRKMKSTSIHLNMLIEP